MIEQQIADERKQLINHWKKLLAKRPNWVANNFSQVKNIASLRATTPPVSDVSVSTWLRRFHDQLGYMAKGQLKDGGLCAGAIFRTQSFIETEGRSGSRKLKTQNVHIEHTIPVKVLRDKIRECTFTSDTEALVWLLKHSIATAFQFDEKETLTGVSSSTAAFDPMSNEYQKPFLRYKGLYAKGALLWNVYDASVVLPDQLTFDVHLQIIFRLLVEAGAERETLDAIERYK